MPKDLRYIEITSRDQWRSWLVEHHYQKESVWVVAYRKAGGDRYVLYEAIAEEALCFGWIDGTRYKHDDLRYRILVTPRKRGSGWSRINKERVDRLIATGQMTSAGLAVIERARTDGTWSQYDDVDALIVPTDLAETLASYPHAEENFASFPPSSRRLILFWIADAKRPETRAKRIEETARLADANERAHH
jgi:uncharacterized protein YdeI (YjbR/CyaY-like superfamily)